MASRQAILHAVLQVLGQHRPYARGEDLPRRIEIQKLVYLAQESLRRDNMTLDYAFNWYLRGPYSPALAKDCYRLDETRAEDVEAVGLKGDAEQAFQPVRALYEHRPEEFDELSHWLELLASLHYYVTRSRPTGSMAGDLSGEEIEQFLQYKTDFEREQVRHAWNALMEAGLIG